MIVPFHRDVKLGTRGPDALAVKRALRRKGFGEGLNFLGLRKFFGAKAVYDLRRFQRRYGIKPTGIYDRATHRKMVDSGGFDRYGAYLMGQAPRAIGNVQGRIVATALFGWNNKDAIHYTEGPERMYGVKNKIRPPQVPHWEDCSSFATWCYWVALAPDPNGLHYSGYGFTGTQIQHGIRVADPREGDLVFYGNKGGIPTHVAIFVGGGKVVSNGSESGPLLLSINYRSDVNQIRRYV